MLDGERQHRIDAAASAFQIDRVDDRTARILFERRLDHVDLNRVDHQRRGHPLGQQLDQGPHLLGLVLPLGERRADVEQVSATLHLLAGDADDLLEVLLDKQPLHAPRALAIDAFADQGRCRVLRHVERLHGAGDARHVAGLTRQRLGSPDALDHVPHVLMGRAAAAADDVDPESPHEVVVGLGQRLGREAVDGDAVHVVGDPGVGNDAQRQARVLAQVADRLPHVLRPRGAVEAYDVHA